MADKTESIWLADDLATESDVEQKFIYPLLTSEMGLQLKPEHIKTKQYVAPTDLDKGAGKKVGYYPDYLVVISGVPTLVIEAKAPGQDLNEAYREALMYASELNKRYPTGINPVLKVVATNGHDFWYGNSDTEVCEKLTAQSLVPGLAAYQQAQADLCRQSLEQAAVNVRSALHESHRVVPIRLIGGPSRQNSELPPNAFAKDLVPLLEKYFNPESTRGNKDIIKHAYCATSQSTKYDALLEALLRSDAKKRIYDDARDIETTKKQAPAFSKAITKAVEKKSSDYKGSPPLVLVIGNVGAGKSIFIDRYYYYLQHDEVQDNTLWAFVDFNHASADLANIDSWIVGQVLSDLPKRNAMGSFKGYENLTRYFAPQLRELREGPLRMLYHDNEAEARKIEAEKLLEWVEDDEKLLEGVLRFYQGDRDKRIVIVFDNGDRRDREQQLNIFQSVQHFRIKYSCISILSLRDETYDRYQNEAPLDAFFKPFLFRIQPPRFLDVIKKRLKLVIQDITEEADRRLQFTLPNGVVMEYPNTDVGKFLIAVYQSIFMPQRKIRVVLEAIAGHDVRRALQMFSQILMSGHVDARKILSARYGGHFELDESRVIRILMRTRYEHFADDHGYIRNLFNVPIDSPTATSFLIPDILQRLINTRKQSHELRIQGYRLVGKLVEELSVIGYSESDLIWGLEQLLKSNLITADHQRAAGISLDDYVKVTASGFYHMRVLMCRAEYMIGVACAVPLRSRDLAGEIAKTCNIGGNEYDYRVEAWLARVEAMREALENEVAIAQSVSLQGLGSTSVDEVSSAFFDVLNRLRYRFNQVAPKQPR